MARLDKVAEFALISLYEAILSDARKMLALAQAGDWDQLIEAEHARNQLLQDLKNEKNVVALDEDLEVKRLQLVQLILLADDETQKLSQVWMSELEGIVGSLNIEKKLIQAYDAR